MFSYLTGIKFSLLFIFNIFDVLILAGSNYSSLPNGCSLLLRRECCSFSNGEYVKAGLAELEHWCYKATDEVIYHFLVFMV